MEGRAFNVEGENDLHSTMVRFIMLFHELELHNNFKIYIPLWLDLLSAHDFRKQTEKMHLHSTMVRFIIKSHLLVLLK